MKRIITFLLVFPLLLSMVGCNSNNADYDASVVFYYRAVDVQYGRADGVIVSETRSANEYHGNYEQLIELYLKGPRDHDHVSPYPAGIYLKKFILGADRAYVTLSSHISMLSGLDLTIACACLTKTVLGLTGVSSIEISTENGTLDGHAYLIYTNNDFAHLDTYADTLH